MKSFFFYHTHSPKEVSLGLAGQPASLNMETQRACHFPSPCLLHHMAHPTIRSLWCLTHKPIAMEVVLAVAYIIRPLVSPAWSPPPLSLARGMAFLLIFSIVLRAFVPALVYIWNAPP